MAKKALKSAKISQNNLIHIVRPPPSGLSTFSKLIIFTLRNFFIHMRRTLKKVYTGPMNINQCSAYQICEKWLFLKRASTVMDEINEHYQQPITKPPLLQRSRLTGGGSPNLVGLVESKSLQRDLWELQIVPTQCLVAPYKSN